MSHRPAQVVSVIGPRISPADLDAFEAEAKHRIPQPYRDFLLKSNGGAPALTVFKFRRKNGRPDEGAVRELFGIKNGKEYDLQFFVELYLDRRRIPDDLFPIADDNCGNLLLMGARGPREGKIYFWDHDFEAPDGEPPTEENVYFVANSLDELLASLEQLIVPAG